MLVRRNRILGIFLFVFSLIYLYFSFRLPPYDLVPVDSDVVPIVLGIILMILSIILFFSKGSEEDEAKQKKLIPENIKDLYMILIVVGLIFIYIWFLERAGFVVTSVLFIFVTTYVLGYRRHIINLIVSVSIPLAFYFVFSSLLEISLPKGILPF
ncbi:MAG TPA: tripartite tricarboxylate transporter TctB family protein [Pseudogracilibacillus sp.]|nr:tripartite tricarboxylate transporter TctB family protein [Pseudogracilibacillus sp.]